MTDLPVIVSGVGRCGTSMIMAMLEAGGFQVLGSAPLYGQPMDGFVESETRAWGGKLPGGPADHVELGWGAAMKVLFPHLGRLNLKCAYKFIWMVRDPLQQAASQSKFAFATRGVQSTREDLRKMAASNMRLGIEGLKMCQEFSDRSTCYARRFEWCLAQPEALARDLAAFVGADLDLDAMRAVVRERPSECSVGMEFMQVTEEAV